MPGGFHGSMVTKEMLKQTHKELANDLHGEDDLDDM